MRKVIAYYRVSTERQRQSGLGLEAQRAAIQRFALTEGLLVIGEYMEAESGKGADALDRRPQLAAALAAARAAKCPVVVAKLDRLSRDVAFVSGPMIEAIQAAGNVGLGAIAGVLNDRGVRTARGGRWHASTVQNLLRRST